MWGNRGNISYTFIQHLSHFIRQMVWSLGWIHFICFSWYFKTLLFLISAPPDCEAGKFSCGDYKFNATYCIQPHLRCDKTYDCHDKSDESNCNYRQQHDGDHECKPVPGEESVGSLWIPKENVCNGYLDCRDKSDEADCPNSNVACEVSCTQGWIIF